VRYLSADPAQRNQEKPALTGRDDREDEQNRTSYGRNTKERDEVRLPTFPDGQDRAATLTRDEYMRLTGEQQ
jgi:hypothetical protein